MRDIVTISAGVALGMAGYDLLAVVVRMTLVLYMSLGGVR